MLAVRRLSPSQVSCCLHTLASTVSVLPAAATSTSLPPPPVAAGVNMRENFIQPHKHPRLLQDQDSHVSLSALATAASTPPPVIPYDFNVSAPNMALRSSLSNAAASIPYTTLHFASDSSARKNRASDGGSGGGGEKPDRSGEKPDASVLKDACDVLLFDLNRFFVRKPDNRLYRRDMVFENRITGRVVTGGLQYVNAMHLLKIYAHFKFAFVRMSVLDYAQDVDEGTIRVHWRISGLSLLRVVVLYLPKRLWKMDNMEKEATVWKEGVSTFWVDGNGVIFRHVADDKWEDRERAAAAKKVDSVKEKLQKLRQEGAPLPSPGM